MREVDSASSARTFTAWSSLEKTATAWPVVGLCPGEAIDHLLDSVRGLQTERLVGYVRDSKHWDLCGRIG